MRNALAHVQKGQHTMVAAAIRQAFLQPDADAAQQTWGHVADQLRGRWPKLAALMDDSEHDVLAYLSENREITGNRQFKCGCIIVPGFGQIGWGDQTHEITGSFQTR